MQKPGFAARRLPFLAAAFACLVVGVAAGLARLGWPSVAPSLHVLHGPLMVSGFFGTLIGLERAVGLGQRWCYAAPTLSGAGSLALILGAPASLGAALIAGSSLVFLAAAVLVAARHKAAHTLTLVLGAACWSVGNFIWLDGGTMPPVVWWWVAFLVFTIAGERLELSRFRPLPAAAPWLFGCACAALFSALLFLPVASVNAARFAGASLAAIALWLLRYDIARATVRQRGLSRYVAVCLLAGYAWLLFAGVLVAGHVAAESAGPVYDASLHSVFLGFVFAMVLGHALIIFPAVLRVALPYHPALYVPLAALQLTLALRVAADLLPDADLRRWSGAGNALALVLFVLTLITIGVHARRSRPHRPLGRR